MYRMIMNRKYKPSSGIYFDGYLSKIEPLFIILHHPKLNAMPNLNVRGFESI